MNKPIEKLNKSIIPLNTTVILAVSGGIDSVCLVDMLAKSELYSQLVIAHYNHQWSEYSREAEIFCREMAATYNLSCEIGHAPSKGPTDEDTARKMRYTWLCKTADKHKTTTILTAHHQDDQVETVLFRILRGTGLRGLSGMNGVTDYQGLQLIRPLLNLTKTELKDYQEEYNLPYLDDPSNNDLNIKRNLIRHRITPLLSEINSAYASHLLNLAQQASEHEKFITEYIMQNNLHQCTNQERILKESPLIQRYIIRSLLQTHHIPDLSLELISRLQSTLHQDGKYNLPNNMALIIRKGRLIIDKQ